MALQARVEDAATRAAAAAEAAAAEAAVERTAREAVMAAATRQVAEAAEKAAAELAELTESQRAEIATVRAAATQKADYTYTHTIADFYREQLVQEAAGAQAALESERVRLREAMETERTACATRVRELPGAAARRPRGVAVGGRDGGDTRTRRLAAERRAR
eukprot:scaffold73356_cov64-Phaeocystis_antarctica.AAC.1